MQTVFTTQSVNTPSVQTGATALAANPNRLGFTIQNQSGANPLLVRLGSGATGSAYHVVLKAGSTAADGNGGIYSQTDGTIYGGAITVAGASPSYTVLEMGGI